MQLTQLTSLSTRMLSREALLDAPQVGQAVRQRQRQRRPNKRS